MDKRQSVQLDKKLVELMDSEWQTATQIQRLSGGETLSVAISLDRLWQAGLIEREMLEIGMGAKRKSGGAQLRRIRYRQKPTGP